MLKIVWTPEAESRYLEILSFWIEHNQSTRYALKIISEVERIEKLMADNPHMGVKVAQTSEEIRRVLILQNFSIFYRVKKSSIEIVSFWENKRNPEDLELP